MMGSSGPAFTLSIVVILGAAGCAWSLDPASMTSISFENAEPIAQTSGYAYHMELDEYEGQGSILFADAGSLKVLTDGNTSVLASGFKYIHGFEQINTTHLAVSDNWDFCLKLIAREDNSVSPLAGECGKAGFEDGQPGKFYQPWSLQVPTSAPTKLLLTDCFNHALRIVDLPTRTVNTVLRSLKYPTGTAWFNGNLLITNSHFIGEVSFSATDYSSAMLSTLAGSLVPPGTKDGAFHSALFDYPYDIHALTNDLYFVAQWNSRKLRLLNMVQRHVQPVCVKTGTAPCTSGSDIGYTYAILKTTDAVYVSTYNKMIIKLTGGSAFDFPTRAAPIAGN